MLCTLVFMYCLQYVRQLSSFRVPTLWFIDLTVATCHIQNMFLSLYQLFHKKTDKTTQTYSYFVILYKNDHRRLLGMQSINTERVSFTTLARQTHKTCHSDWAKSKGNFIWMNIPSFTCMVITCTSHKLHYHRSDVFTLTIKIIVTHISQWCNCCT